MSTIKNYQLGMSYRPLSLRALSLSKGRSLTSLYISELSLDVSHSFDMTKSWNVYGSLRGVSHLVRESELERRSNLRVRAHIHEIASSNLFSVHTNSKTPRKDGFNFLIHEAA